MSERTQIEIARERVKWRLRNQLPLIVVLVVLWMLLWGAVSWLNLATGILLAILVTRVFYLPSVELAGRFNLWYALVFLWHFAGDLVRASFQVALLAFRGVRTNSVIAVQLVSRSDLITTLTAISISLIPGSIVIEVDRERSILYLHVIDTEDESDVAGAHDLVMRVEARIIRTLGSANDVEKVS